MISFDLSTNRVIDKLIQRLASDICKAVKHELVLSDTAIENIKHYLQQRCIEVLAPSISVKFGLAFAIQEGQHPSVSASNHTNIKKDFCLLFESDKRIEDMVNNALISSAASISEALFRITQHRQTLQATLQCEINRISNLRIHKGETHNRGRQVIMVEIGGRNIVYKPVDLRPQQLFREVAIKISKIEGLSTIGSPAVLVSEPMFGIMEYVDTIDSPPDKDRCKDHYFCTGVLSALVHCLGIIDIHYDNFLMTSCGPVVLDIETLFYPFNGKNFPSILDTQLIGDKRFSGITGGGKMTKVGIEVQCDSNMLAVGYGKSTYQTANRLPANHKKTQLINPRIFKKEIVDGFHAGYRAVCLAKDSIFSSANNLLRQDISCRYVLRNTSHYLIKQIRLLQPRPQYDRGYLQRLSNSLLRSLPSTDPELHTVVQCEMRDLLNMDIPFFSTRSQSKNLYHFSGTTINRYFKETQVSRAHRYYRRISSSDMKRQMEIILREFD